jgi:hypothetical protein
MTLFGKPDIDDLVRRNKPRSLIEALDHHDPEVRAAAAAGLADLGEMHALEPLAQHVQTDPDPVARDAAAAALQRLLDELEEEGPHGEHAAWRESREPFRTILSSSGWLGSGGRL